MNTKPFDATQLHDSVFAVPPLARDASLEIDGDENEKIIRFLEAGGVRSLLYGGNAVLYHVRLSEYADLLAMLADSAGPDTTVVPSVGPSFGMAMDQADVLGDFDFPTAMLLPARDVVDEPGIAAGVRQLADRLGKPLVLYLKFDRWLAPELVQSLHDDGVISWVKYAVVRENPARDDYLRELLDRFPADRVVSGIGEQPAIVHLRDFGVAGFTSGCVCVAPGRSMDMLGAIQTGQYEMAESIRRWFLPLEDLRNEISPIRVLHHAVREAGIAETGRLPPMLSDLAAADVRRIAEAVSRMTSGSPAG